MRDFFQWFRRKSLGDPASTVGCAEDEKRIQIISAHSVSTALNMFFGLSKARARENKYLIVHAVLRKVGSSPSRFAACNLAINQWPTVRERPSHTNAEVFFCSYDGVFASEKC